MHRTLVICQWSVCVRGALTHLVLTDALVWLLVEGSAPEIITLLASLSSLYPWAVTFKPCLSFLICKVGIVIHRPCLTRLLYQWKWTSCSFGSHPQSI